MSIVYTVSVDTTTEPFGARSPDDSAGQRALDARSTSSDLGALCDVATARPEAIRDPTS